jgi:hypothetical protein
LLEHQEARGKSELNAIFRVETVLENMLFPWLLYSGRDSISKQYVFDTDVPVWMKQSELPGW